MELRVAIATYADRPQPTFGERISAVALARDVKALFDRTTGLSLRFPSSTSMADVWTSDQPIDPRLMMGNNSVAFKAGSDGWWDAWELCQSAGHDPRNDVWFVIQYGSDTDTSGIAQPAWAPGIFWDDDAHPDIGGIATVGLGILERYLGANQVGVSARRSVITGSHELGHAMGVHHPPFGVGPGLEDPTAFKLDTIMGYGGNWYLASGQLDNGVPFNPRLALPEEILVWRAHDVFEPLADRQDGDTPGVEDFVSVRVRDLKYLVPRIDAADTLSELRARLLHGGLWNEPTGGN